VNLPSFFRAGKRPFKLEYPLVMGIVNVTPDSFYKESRLPSVTLATEKAVEMWKQGACILDVGGVSTRPGSNAPSLQEEIKRVVPVIEQIKKEIPDCIISVDTYRHEVVKSAVQAGADLVNDVSSGSLDNKMLPTIARLNVPYIAMHMQGTPQTMQQKPVYHQVVEEIVQYFFNLKTNLHDQGIYQLIFDPGFGFGKTIQHNYQLLFSLEAFKILNTPLLAGISRKSMIYKLMDYTPEESLTATTALHWELLSRGASILRVHDVQPAFEIIQLFNKAKQVLP